jgi:hypothetical protein
MMRTIRTLPALALATLAAAGHAQCDPQWMLLGGSGPGARFVAATAHDPARNVDVLFGGAQQIVGGTFWGDTWEFDRASGSWSQRATIGPLPRYGIAGFFMGNAATGVYIFGGSTVPEGLGSMNDTWRWDGATWHVVSTGMAPSPRYAASTAYDSARQRVVLFGGLVGSASLGDTWEFDGVTWLPMGAPGPIARGYAGLAYHPGMGRTVLFGGNASGSEMGDTWLWDGAAWTQVFPSPAPSPRLAPQMAYDPSMQKVVLFGGLAGAALEDIWVFDGQWSQMPSTTPHPGGRAGAAMTFNSAGEMLMMGGWTGSAVAADSWTWGCPPPSCYANCDGSTTPPVLNVEDFSCFINEFAAAQALPHQQQLAHYANCDQSTTPPVLNVEDFTCFINRFAQGCL